MKPDTPPSWNELRTAYQPPAPELDTGAIMATIRHEATIQPLRPVRRGPVAAIPVWACAAAASLALLATVSVVGRSVTVADRTISQAWMQDIEPQQLEENILSFTAGQRKGNEI
jgi:hypothetical protein